MSVYMAVLLTLWMSIILLLHITPFNMKNERFCKDIYPVICTLHSWDSHNYLQWLYCEIKDYRITALKLSLSSGYKARDFHSGEFQYWYKKMNDQIKWIYCNIHCLASELLNFRFKSESTISLLSKPNSCDYRFSPSVIYFSSVLTEFVGCSCIARAHRFT